MVTCAHNGRAIGPCFEVCLACQDWRMVGTEKWWSTPIPCAPADDDSGTEYEDSKSWLDEEAA